jgi:DNA-binding winged helix-turn-helix (wHTH) protein
MDSGAPRSIPPRLAFGPFTFAPDTGELWHDNVAVPLQPRPARALAYCLARPGTLVTRDELIRHLWPEGHHVDFNLGLNFCIRQVRAALDDGARAPRYLETLARRGYRWIAPVVRVEASRPDGGEGRRAPRRVVLKTPVPAWGALALTAVSSLLTSALLVGPPLGGQPVSPPLSPRLSDVSLMTDAQQTVDALHKASHLVVDRIVGVDTAALWRGAGAAARVRSTCDARTP